MTVHLLHEIEQLKKEMYTLCSMVEKNLQQAIKSIIERDKDLALNTITRDLEVDKQEIFVEEACLKILALYQPVATDLRFIISALKINNDLERIGDLAVNIAERTALVSKYPVMNLNFDFTSMHKKAMNMLRMSLDAYMQRDPVLSYEVCTLDDEVDVLNRNMYEIFKQQVALYPDRVELLMQYLSISRYLERIADHATNIAEDVIYMVEGTIIRHRRKQTKLGK